MKDMSKQPQKFPISFYKNPYAVKTVCKNQKLRTFESEIFCYVPSKQEPCPT